jgi:hypothetical protein
MSENPGALQLRLLQTVVEVAAEKNSTLVMPFPVEMLRFFERHSRDAADDEPAHRGSGRRTPSETPALPEATDPALPEAIASPTNGAAPVARTQTAGKRPAAEPLPEPDNAALHNGSPTGK